MRPRAAIALTVVLAVGALLHGYPAWRLLHSTGWLPGAAWWISAVAGTLLLIGLFTLGHGRKRDVPALIGDLWLAAIFQLFTWTLIGELPRAVLALAGVENPRRSVIIASAVLAVVVLLLAWGLWRALGPIRVRRIDVPLPRLPGTLDGTRIVQIADTHFSLALGRRWAHRLVTAVNAEDAPIVCHTGDIADGDVQRREETVAELAAVTAAHRFFITGNHEYFTDTQHWIDRMTGYGWTFLHNAHRVIQQHDELVIAGIDDPTGVHSPLDGHGPDLDAALDGAPSGQPVILLAHQPKQVRDAVRRDVDLQLSGHTHGGQIWPFHLIVRLEQRALRGLVRKGRNTLLYTSRGAGFWGPPIRIGAPPELTVLTLRAASAGNSAR